MPRATTSLCGMMAVVKALEDLKCGSAFNDYFVLASSVCSSKSIKMFMVAELSGQSSSRLNNSFDNCT